MDIVAFSDPKIHATEQINKIKQLNKIVRSSKTFGDSDPNKRIVSTTGDGMVICFGESCEQPFYLALEIFEALNEYNKDKEDKHEIKLRIGLHTGVVFEVTDMTGNKNVCGSGVIIARRVMDEGRVGHILATDMIAKELKRLKPAIDNMIKKVGPREIKHGEILNIYNIYDEKEGIGNPTDPFSTKKHKLTIKSFPPGVPVSISRICSDCKAKIPVDSKFCNKCGYKL